MAKNSKGKGLKAFVKAIAVLLLVAILIVAGGVVGYGWATDFTWKKPTEPELEAQFDGGLVTSTEGGENISAVTRRIAPASFKAYSIPQSADSAVTIEISYNITPTSPTVKWWAPHFVNSSSAWAQGKSASDYIQIAPTAAGALTATATCVAAFGEPIEITVENQFVNSSCKIRFDYVKNVKIKDDATIEKGLPVMYSSLVDSMLSGFSSMRVTYDDFRDFDYYTKQIIGYDVGTITPDWVKANVTTSYDALFDYPSDYIRPALNLGGNFTEDICGNMMIFGDSDEASGDYDWIGLDNVCDNELLGNLRLVVENDDCGSIYLSVKIEAQCFYNGVVYRTSTFNTLLCLSTSSVFFNGCPLANYQMTPNPGNVIF